MNILMKENFEKLKLGDLGTATLIDNEENL